MYNKTMLKTQEMDQVDDTDGSVSPEKNSSREVDILVTIVGQEAGNQ